MELLKFFEGIRTPVLDEFFLLITKFGEETFLVFTGLIIFWCISKKQGYYLLSVGFSGILINQFLKIVFRVPRPWIKDKDFTIVERAREAAAGFSFPSGHTQISVGAFGAICRANKALAVRIAAAAICVLVPLSRMYLGVHTPQDVLTSVVIAVALVFIYYPVICKNNGLQNMRKVFLTMGAFAVGYILFVEFAPLSIQKSDINYITGVENAYKILGCIAGMWLGYEADEKFTKFDTGAVWYGQIGKVAIGLMPVLVIKSLLKEPLKVLLGGWYGADALRYFLLVFFITGIWPITFKYFGRLGNKRRK